MKSETKGLILTGGILNSFFALFHLYLAYQIYKVFGATNAYPLMQMLNVAGCAMIFFLAFTSIAFADELVVTKLGRWVIRLNLLVYSTRIIGELLLFPKPKVIVIAVCLVMCVIYVWACILARKLDLKNPE